MILARRGEGFDRQRPPRLCAGGVFLTPHLWGGMTSSRRVSPHLARSSQKATALAAATFRESTPWAMGMRTV